jgi:hypothetical protein
MPNRPPNRLKNRSRPKWNREPDYWLREKELLKLVQRIRSEADSFVETEHVCPGCDERIWEARRGKMIKRGCHCRTLMVPPGNPLYDFKPESWASLPT